MTTFVGRFVELRFLSGTWEEVLGGQTGGRCVLLTGGPGEGKTRLVGEFLRRSRTDALWFAHGSPDTSRPLDPAEGPATIDLDRRGQQTTAEESVGQFVLAAANAAPLSRADVFRDLLAPDWETAFRLLADAVDQTPSIAVIDNASDLIDADSSFSPALRRAWHRYLRAKPILLIVSGHDLTSLSADLGEEARSLALLPFSPAELGTVLSLDPVGAMDAHIITGGHADIAAQWPTGVASMDAVSTMLGRSPSVLELRGELQLARHIGLASQLERVLVATGPGESSRANIGRVAALPPASLDRSLKSLVADRLMIVERPLSLQQSREARYRIADPYLRFWLRAIAPRREDIARGRMELVVADIGAQWALWRRRAMQVLAREAMDALAAGGHLPGTAHVGAYWNRFEDVRIDLVGTDVADKPRAITFVGALKWDASAPFDAFDLASLISVRKEVPGVTDTTPLVAVSLGGTSVGSAVAASLGPNELIAAWRA